MITHISARTLTNRPGSPFMRAESCTIGKHGHHIPAQQVQQSVQQSQQLDDHFPEPMGAAATVTAAATAASGLISASPIVQMEDCSRSRPSLRSCKLRNLMNFNCLPPREGLH